MKTPHDDVAALRSEIAKRETARSRLTPDLRLRCARYAVARRASGAVATTIARELGVAEASVSRWLRAASTATLVPVHVVDVASESMPAGAVVVVTPRGLRVEGLDVDALCAVIARVG